jgi:hypothetical protein
VNIEPEPLKSERGRSHKLVFELSDEDKIFPKHVTYRGTKSVEDEAVREVRVEFDKGIDRRVVCCKRNDTIHEVAEGSVDRWIDNKAGSLQPLVNVFGRVIGIETNIFAFNTLDITCKCASGAIVK